MVLAIRRAATLAAFALAAACVSGPEVIVNADPASDLAGFRTFGYMQPLGTDRSSGERTPLSGHLMAATTRELEDRGFRYTRDEPELLVNFVSSSQTGIDTRNRPIAPSTIRGYGAWPSYRTSMSTLNSITEGSVGVDIVNRQTNTLVWEATARDRVTEAMRDNQRQVVGEAVAKMFADFPRRP